MWLGVLPIGFFLVRILLICFVGELTKCVGGVYADELTMEMETFILLVVKILTLINSMYGKNLMLLLFLVRASLVLLFLSSEYFWHWICIFPGIDQLSLPFCSCHASSSFSQLGSTSSVLNFRRFSTSVIDALVCADALIFQLLLVLCPQSLAGGFSNFLVYPC